MLATAKCAALTRSRLVRQVSSVLPLTAGKMGMAPWANLRGSFTTRDNVHVACLHHSHPSFPRHSKKPWHPPTHMKNNDQAKSTHYLAVLRVKRGGKKGRLNCQQHTTRILQQCHTTRNSYRKATVNLETIFNFGNAPSRTSCPIGCYSKFGHNVRTDANQAWHVYLEHRQVVLRDIKTRHFPWTLIEKESPLFIWHVTKGQATELQLCPTG